MEVILKKRVEKLGQMGDIVNVKAGYARNFLLRRDLADVASKEKIEHFEKQRAQLEAENLQFKKEAEAVAGKMHGLRIYLVRSAGDSGILYGSVRPKDIAEAVTENGFSINRDQVRFKNAIKMIGLHQVEVVLHPEVAVPVSVVVALTIEEAKALAAQASAAN